MNSNSKNLILFGLYLALTALLLDILNIIFKPNNSLFSIVSWAILILVLLFVQKQYKKTLAPQFVSYAKILKPTLLMILVSTAMCFIFFFIYFKFIDKNYVSNMLNEALIIIEKQNINKEMTSSVYDFFERYFTPLGVSLSLSFSSMFFYFFVSLITSSFVRDKQDPYNSAMSDISNE